MDNFEQLMLLLFLLSVRVAAENIPKPALENADNRNNSAEDEC